MLFTLRVLNPVFLLLSMMLSPSAYAAEASVQESQSLTSPYTMPATAYLALAKNQAGIEQQSLLLMAAGRFIYDGQWQNGLGILSQMHDLTPELANEKKILLAKVELIRQKPRLAITQLAAIQSIETLPLYYQAQFHELLAHAYQLVGNVMESVTERIKLETVLPDKWSKANNRRVLWLSLATLPVAELNTWAIESHGNAILKGWVQLAVISRRHAHHVDALLDDISQWQVAHPGHPANDILPSPLSSVTSRLFSFPKQMALLLPLSGPLAGPGTAIKDGFMAAVDANHDRYSTVVKFYNTDSTDVAALYQQALTDGAEYVVGPLSKTDAAIVAKLPHPVPTLLLNDVGVATEGNAYQFGLSPSHEARQVAAKARSHGHVRALAIAPMGAWGDDVLSAFTEQWQASGGIVVDVLHYGPQDDMTHRLRDFLQVSHSEARGKQLQHALGANVEWTPQRRQDFDVIFLLAYPSKARQIMPLLNYYFAGNVPVYSTSIAYGGSANPMRDRDLDGLIFCDMPWVFDHQVGSRNWPEPLNSYNRLYALGMDSYTLSSQLNQLLLFPAMGIHDKSGVLYLTPSQQIARILVWGQFKQGLAQALTH